MTDRIPGQARVIVIGGGAIGTSVAWQLARAGEKDVLLLEKSRLTHGCTWHAAGLVGQLRGKRNLTRLMQNSVAVMDELESATQTTIGWKKVGSLRLAGSPERWSEIRRSMSQAKGFGVECHALSAAEAASRFPYVDTQGVEGAAFIPADGYVDPYSLTQGFAKAGRAEGARIIEGVTVSDLVVEGRRVTQVVTNHGTIACEILVNCAGLWAKRVGEMAGVPLAAGVVEHQYFLTERALKFPTDLTTLRDPDNNFYLKPDTGAFAIGGWEAGMRGCWRGRPPLEFGQALFEADLDRLQLFAEPACKRLPVLNDIGIQTVINGPIPVSADGEPIMGLAPELDNFFVACGFTAGIAASGGAGLAMAHWILEDDPGTDLWAFDVRRFSRAHAQGRYLERRAIEAYAAYYSIHWPQAESEAGRGLRRSPLHAHLTRAGACFGSKFGWERPNWFAPAGTEPVDRPSFEAKPNWFDAVGEECHAIRGGVALIDQSSFSKFEIRGRGAHDALNAMAANTIPPEPGGAVYTQLCNEGGGIEADLTIIHSAAEVFYVVTGAGFGVRDGQWIRSQLPADGSVQMRDITASLATLNLCGPKAREVLRAVTDDDVSGHALPFRGVRQLELGLARVLAVRVGYVGELGYELYVDQEYAAHVYEQLMDAGRDHGISNAGYRAIESCRLEKAYLYWSAELSPDFNPYEAGLGFCVNLHKGPFTGREALVSIRSRPLTRRLVTLSLDGFVPLHGGEPVSLDDELLGSVTSAGFGHTLGKTIALCYLPAQHEQGVPVTVEAFGHRYQAFPGSRCLYDPERSRLNA